MCLQYSLPCMNDEKLARHPQLTPVASPLEIEVDMQNAALEGSLKAALVRALPLLRHNPITQSKHHIQSSPWNYKFTYMSDTM